MRNFRSSLLVLSFTLIAAGSGSSSDAAFVRAALQSGSQELARATVASNSTNTVERQYAGLITADHSQANQRLIAIAGPKGIDTSAGTSPSAISGNSPEPAGGANATQVAAQAPNPATYFRTEIAAHKTGIALFRKEASSGHDPQLRSFASSVLPALEKHLKMAQKDLALVNAAH
ncbi:MAG TPA: DUF4142 domain-containing protein [Candidatus Baltobacteraceae bacterium]|jgi:putative membrane protein|nr:DUF4142 domain-containing protein [Candidatus Baltobacteraceae bacterium]